jgi:hypothetical protein
MQSSIIGNSGIALPAHTNSLSGQPLNMNVATQTHIRIYQQCNSNGSGDLAIEACCYPSQPYLCYMPLLVRMLFLEPHWMVIDLAGFMALLAWLHCPG